MPASLRHRALQLAHVGHQGLIKTKQLLREKIWFSCIDKQAETLVKHCLPCQSANPENKLEPLKMSPLPSGPWRHVAADFYGPLPSGQTLMVVIDEYSRFVEVETVSLTSAAAVDTQTRQNICHTWHPGAAKNRQWPTVYQPCF